MAKWIPAAKLGLGYGLSRLRRLIDLVGPSFAKEIFFTARQFTAAEALAMGLVNRVVPVAELEDYVGDYAKRIAENAPLTVNAVKRIVAEAMKDPDERDEALCERLVAECFASDDYVGWLPAAALLFSESTGRIVLTCAEQDGAALEQALGQHGLIALGRTIEQPDLRVSHGNDSVLSLSLAQLRAARKEALEEVTYPDFFGRETRGGRSVWVSTELKAPTSDVYTFMRNQRDHFSNGKWIENVNDMEILGQARARAERLVQRSELVRAAEKRARQTVEQAEAEARRMRLEAEDYCDQKLGSFEIVLERTMRMVAAGRQKLQLRSSRYEEGAEGEEPPPAAPQLAQVPDGNGGLFDQDRS